ncbi:hypothetical protein LOZ66_004006 [Ophidiomyces ophidiicola]|nr:hypothetical protein LOZ66_004006 [Ophidiomyces ophidiicola]
MKTVIKELRVYTGRIRAERYKFLLYEPGAFFLPHQDSPKANGMFGTLVVCLPSKHDGGEVVVTHQGKSRILESAATSGSSTSFAAWYSDVSHEIKPVKSGHRMVITYNLIHDGPGDTPSFVPVDPNLETAMKGWISEAESGRGLAPEFLLYMLSHEYPTSGLKFESMKGKDDPHVAQLRFGHWCW